MCHHPCRLPHSRGRSDTEHAYDLTTSVSPLASHKHSEWKVGLLLIQCNHNMTFSVLEVPNSHFVPWLIAGQCLNSQNFGITCGRKNPCSVNRKQEHTELWSDIHRIQEIFVMNLWKQVPLTVLTDNKIHVIHRNNWGFRSVTRILCYLQWLYFQQKEVKLGVYRDSY